MRISTAQIFDTGARHMGRAQTEIARTQEQIAAGKRLLSPADDPAAAAIALAIRQDKARSAQYQRNADLAEGDLRQQDSVLESVGNVLLEVKDLAMQAGNATLSVSERAAIVTALNGAGEQLRALFNTRTASGDYLFAGGAADQVPFVASASGQIEYQGDELARHIDIGAGITVQSRDSGRKLFVDVPTAAPTFVARAGADNGGSATVSVGHIVDPAAYAGVHPDDIVVSFPNPPGTYAVSSVDRVSGALTPLVAPTGFTLGNELTITVAGVEVTISGNPQPGDGFTLEADHAQPIALTVQRLAQGLGATPDTQQGAIERERVIATALGDLDLALQSLDGGRTAAGTRLARLDTARSEQQGMDLANDELASDLVDLDLGEAASRLAFQTLVLQAAQQSLAKIAGLSLFSFLR
ncbi:MAG: flagellar hook-associated protein FlgL [Pseudomonadales bacterium]|jgi:flagellar hook-associated protein 3 FlgL|nr:flagellar hook-associated protein FlgL [Pseudomonadales bacterium]MCP5320807.1 flagellar hook-associated protein FlgL [Pseudomonadales bacterium]MCP5337606.1 flagellar hook-associated protein FlgL [Pseudomonadales bacterium]